ncbi:MAG: hypothetical protein GF331_20915 [Chitinivibrionales bacterium]|nr:hypothetical protein [Chitinivibrionales bacterium]
MKRVLSLVSVAGVVFGLCILSCAPYNELKPKPELNPAEGGYLPLMRDEDKPFELKAGKQYYITFPAPPEENFYIILNIPKKPRFTSFFTSTLIDERKPGEKIADQSPFPDSQSVYPVSPKSPTYYWIIENVPQDIDVAMRYRYAPQWRFKFETRYASLKETYETNVVDRAGYEAIKPGYSIESVNFPLAIDTIGKHTAALEKVLAELLEIESLFPSKLINSNDPAYRNYVDLKKALEDEIAFQKNYRLTLDFFYKEQQTRKSPLELVARVDDFIGFFEKKDDLTPGAVELAKNTLQRRLGEVGPFYDQRLANKNDAKPFSNDYFRYESYTRLPKLCELAGIGQPPAFQAQYRFMTDYQNRAYKVQALRDSLDQLSKQVAKIPAMPTDKAFEKVTERAQALQAKLPAPIDQAHGRYKDLPGSVQLNQAIADVRQKVTERVDHYRMANALVPQLNILKTQRDYPIMLGMLRDNAQLDFLLDKYRALDTMSINEQARRVRDALSNGAWSTAEGGLRELHADQNFIDAAQSMPIKHSMVRKLEDSLYIRIDRVTRARVMKFLEENVEQLHDIDSLYEDSAFLPVHDVTFSSGGRRELQQRKEQLVADLARMKEYEFPAKAVSLLYEQFLKNPADSGVYRARAIVAHGKHYQGDDLETQIRIAEADPTAAKWISKPKKYRRVFALPITDNDRRGVKNSYMVRLNVRIETEAKFPVYDVNVKLPREVAQNASSEQWYDRITLNRKELRNEGRFTIGAPTAENGYECQITPVQMTPTKNNVLEIRFTHPSFKPLPVSVMVQKPIIKKH